MSSSDLFVEGFPHGTPQGYDDGCRGGACPAGIEYGLSCKLAKQKSRGDYQYQQLVKKGATVAEIADALGFVGTETAAAVVVTPAKSTPKASPSTAKGGRAIAAEPKPAKDAAAMMLDEKRARREAENATPEPVVEDPAPKTPEPPRMNGRRASSSTIATGNASGSTTEQPAAKPAEIRAWAIAKGYQVSAKGKLPQHIIDHYWEATGRLDADTDESKLSHEDAATPPGADTIQIEIQIPADTVAGERYVVPGMSIAGEDVEQARAARPEWGQVAESEDVEAARSLAVRLEQELAHAEAQRDAEHEAAAGLADVLIDLAQQLEIAKRAAAAGETATRLALQKWAKERADNEASYSVILDQAITINRLNRQIFENRLDHTIANLEDVFTADLLPQIDAAPTAEIQKTRRRLAWRNR